MSKRVVQENKARQILLSPDTHTYLFIDIFVVINASRFLHNVTFCKAIVNGIFGYFFPSACYLF